MLRIKAASGLSLGSALLLLLAACGGASATPTPTLESIVEPTPLPTAQPPGRDRGEGVDDSAEVDIYKWLADRAMNDIGLLAPLLSQVGIALASNPDEAQETRETVETVRDALELTLTQLVDAPPPQLYEELHWQLTNALTLYTQAAEALLPSEETGEADYWAFQSLMQQAGGNAHGAGATLGQLSAAGADRAQ